PAPTVQAASIVRQNLSAYVTSNGKVEPIEPHVMRAELQTFVESVSATDGQPVRRGQLLVTLDSADARAQLAQARGALLTAQEDLRVARAGGPADELAQLDSDTQKAQLSIQNLQRLHDALEKLLTDHAATQDELAQNQLSLDTERASLAALQQKREDLRRRAALDVHRDELRVEQNQEQIRSLEEKVSSSEVRSPIDGTLYSLPVQPNLYVQVGTVLAEIADLHQVRVRAFVDEPDLGWLEPNQQVDVTWDALPGRDWNGVTSQIPKQVVKHDVRSVGEVLCSVSNDKLELLPNVNVAVRIRVRDRQNVLVVPREAVHSDGAQHYVFVVKDDRLQRRAIEVGVASATQYEVSSGLSQGDHVALPGDSPQRDGMEVRELEPQAEAGK
ncbi:MAG: efflux RND transporter periplasmic adaptor subunit, partial [Steroidobacteraceae bacterium]